jgi:hypothetical protein
MGRLATMTVSVPPPIQQPQDVSSEILSKLNETSDQTLNAQLASAWVEELEASIQQTKVIAAFCSILLHEVEHTTIT